MKCYILSFIFFGLLSFAVSSQEIRLSELTNQAFIDSTKYYADLSNKLGVSEVIAKFQQGKFRRANQFDEILGVGKYNFWINIDVYNDSNLDKDVIIEFSIARLKYFTVYEAKNNGFINHGTCYGFDTHLKNNRQANYNHALKVHFNANSKTKLFIVISKSSGSVRNSLKLHTTQNYEQNQHYNYTKLSFYLAIILVVSLSNFTVWFYTRQSKYLVFAVLIACKGILNLQFGEFSQILTNLGVDYFSTSTFIMLILLLQYHFFKYYFKESVKKSIYFIVIFLTILDLLFGRNHQINSLYYYLNYAFLFLMGVTFIIEIFKKRAIFSFKDIPFLSVQILPILIFMLLVLNYRVSFANNFFRKYDFELFYYASLIELIVYLYYLFEGIINLNKINLIQADNLNKLQNRIIETQESERRKIATDLHDDLGSTLSVLKDKIDAKDSESKELINKAIGDLRSISHNLMPPNFEIFGFIPSLEKYIETLNQLSLKITLIVFGNKITLHDETELNIYRILTEILHNIRKHSQSKEATIQLIYHDTFLYVSVENNDKIEKNLEKNVGIGEKSISSRLEYLHARVLEEGKTQNGYSYIFEVPYEKNPNR